MKPVIYYGDEGLAWWGYWVDNSGNQIGDAINAYKKKDCKKYLEEIRNDRYEQMLEEQERGVR